MIHSKVLGFIDLNQGFARDESSSLCTKDSMRRELAMKYQLLQESDVEALAETHREAKASANINHQGIFTTYKPPYEDVTKVQSSTPHSRLDQKPRLISSSSESARHYAIHKLPSPLLVLGAM